MKKIAVYGYGNIGNGVARVVTENAGILARRLGEELEVKYVLDIRDFPGDFMESKVVHDVDIIVKDPEIEVVCETMGGLHPAYEFTKMALEAGKSVCTSNKELVAEKGPELLQVAREHSCNYLFEASVGGGIPIIRPMISSLVPEEIKEIMGILNGTTNYMLTKMAEDGADYDQVLKQAQDLGYAERNPEADVEGKDSARKIAILASLMAGKTYPYANVARWGITKLTKEDFLYAKKLRMKIRLLGMARMDEENRLTAMVSPCMLPKAHPLSPVRDVNNAIYVTGNLLGPTMFYGAGAGKLPTASAVVSDVVEALRNEKHNIPAVWEDEEALLGDPLERKASFFFRIPETKREKTRELFGKKKYRVVDGVLTGEVGIIVRNITQKDFLDKMEELKLESWLRVEGLTDKDNARLM